MNAGASEPVIAVVGGGPAGCAAALGFAGASGRRNCRIVLFEAGGAVTNKACGDALVVGAVAALDSLGIGESDLAALGARPTGSIVTHRRLRPREVLPLAPFQMWTLARSVLDKALRDRASAVCELRLDSRVTAIESLGNGWRLSVECGGVPQQIAADGVVAATGSAGNFAAIHGIGGAPARAVAVTQYTRRRSFAEGLHFAFRGDVAPGYLWAFPMASGSANWGVWMPSECSIEPLVEIRLRMIRLSRLRGFSQPRAAVANLWSGRGGIWHSPAGLVSCGDAAGLVDPYSGEGIWAALTSGARAGAAMAAFVSGSRGALEDYSQWVGDTFGPCYGRRGERALFWNAISGG